MHIHEPEMADRWEKHTPKGKKLPKHVREDGTPTMAEVFEERHYTYEPRSDGMFYVTTPTGNEQFFQSPEKARQYIDWHHGLSGDPNPPQIQEPPPKMEAVFNNKPPQGSVPFKPEKFKMLGQAGTAAEKGLEALDGAGMQYEPFATPDGRLVAYPDKTGVGGDEQNPMGIDLAKGGILSPITGSQHTNY